MAQEIAKEGLKVVKQPLYGPIDWHSFDVKPADTCQRISEVEIMAGDVIDSVTFTMEGGQGSKTRQKFGGNGGGLWKVAPTSTSLMVLKPGEYITQISGSIANYGGRVTPVLAQLRIHTNLAPGGYALMGTAKNCYNIRPFASPVLPDSRVVGFHGWYKGGDFVRSIGVYTAKNNSCSPYVYS